MSARTAYRVRLAKRNETMVQQYLSGDVTVEHLAREHFVTDGTVYRELRKAGVIVSKVVFLERSVDPMWESTLDQRREAIWRKAANAAHELRFKHLEAEGAKVAAE